MTATYAEARADLKQACVPLARKIAELTRNRHHQAWNENWRDVKRWHPTKMDFAYIKDDFPISLIEFTTKNIPGGQEAVKVWFNKWASIAFYGWRPRDGAKAKVTRSAPVLLEPRIIRSATIDGTNNTNNPQPLGKKFSEVKGKGGSTDLGAKVSASFRQLIKAGGEATGFVSETELTTAIEASTNVNKWASETLGAETEWPGEIPPHMYAEVTRVLRVGRFRQMVTTDGDLNCDITIRSEGDFDINFSGRDDLLGLISGSGNTNSPYGHYRDWSNLYAKHPLPDLAYWMGALGAPIMARAVEADEADQAERESWEWTAKMLPSHPDYREEVGDKAVPAE